MHVTLALAIVAFIMFLSGVQFHNIGNTLFFPTFHGYGLIPEFLLGMYRSYTWSCGQTIKMDICINRCISKILAKRFKVTF